MSSGSSGPPKTPGSRFALLVVPGVGGTEEAEVTEAANGSGRLPGFAGGGVATLGPSVQGQSANCVTAATVGGPSPGTLYLRLYVSPLSAHRTLWDISAEH